MATLNARRLHPACRWVKPAGLTFLPVISIADLDRRLNRTFFPAAFIFIAAIDQRDKIRLPVDLFSSGWRSIFFLLSRSFMALKIFVCAMRLIRTLIFPAFGVANIFLLFRIETTATFHVRCPEIGFAQMNFMT